MNRDTAQRVSRRDIGLVRRTLTHLTAAQKITCVIVIALVAFVWWHLLNRILDFGRSIDYGGQYALGAETATLLQRYNPFFWWGLIALISLLLIYLLYGFVAATQRRVQRKLLARHTVEQLVQQLSAPALDVLDWAWQDRRDPLSVDDLQRALSEMRSQRFQKITLAREHQALLDAAVRHKKQ